jgi:small GTP-binding protein
MEERRPIKIILVGSSGVGKTSLINSYFDQPPDTETSPTVAPAFVATSVRLDDKQVIDLHIWDTAGQERFQSIGGMFYRDSDVAFVCFDFSSLETVADWTGRVRRQVPECIIFLVGTKSDLLGGARVQEFRVEGQKKLEEVQAEQFSLTSSVDGSGVKELFRAAAKCSSGLFAPAVPATVPVRAADRRAKKEPCDC